MSNTAEGNVPLTLARSELPPALRLPVVPSPEVDQDLGELGESLKMYE